ncbi:MAG: trehalose-phosphatase, partial [Solirubrobacterales bacterium]
VTKLIETYAIRHAAYVGDDMTDVDAFEALGQLLAQGRLDSSLCIGVASEEQPTSLIERADVMVAGPQGVTELLRSI